MDDNHYIGLYVFYSSSTVLHTNLITALVFVVLNCDMSVLHLNLFFLYEIFFKASFNSPDSVKNFDHKRGRKIYEEFSPQYVQLDSKLLAPVV